jgi:hypothetical protein
VLALVLVLGLGLALVSVLALLELAVSAGAEVLGFESVPAAGFPSELFSSDLALPFVPLRAAFL